MRRIGRPPLDEEEQSAQVHVRLAPQQYDALYAKAQRERVSVPEVVRRALDRELGEREKK